MGKLFKYTPVDFGELTVKVEHFDLLFDVFDDQTIVTSHMRFKAKKDMGDLILDAKNLEVKSVSSADVGVVYNYDNKASKLKVHFARTIKKDEEITLKSVTITKPTKNILEGLYYDVSPKGAPPTQITQCQQWGFQRMVPCIDDMTAKCTYTTTIRADNRYTHIISNGDQKGGRKDIAHGRVEVTFENHKTPMAPYLFFLGVGTYQAVTQEFEYPNGDKFALELLVPPDADTQRAKQALEILYDCVMWVHLFTGPDTYKNWESSKKIWALRKNFDKNRAEIQKLSEGMTFGYQYTGAVYREIGMQNSDYGGMENVGNTTITTNRIMPFVQMTDPYFEYMVRVKVHEYYHNINGSEVTGWSPFEIWLNEAVTVHIEQAYHSFIMGSDYTRLEIALSLIAPGHGTYAQDEGPAALPIEPDGFNDVNELITSVTYIKSPEFVRMIETIIGKDNFAKALHNYHSKFAHSNAKREDWIFAMEEVSGIDLKRMARVWLKQTGFPTLKATTQYQNGKFTLHVVQSGFKGDNHWEFPMSFALFDKQGKVLTEGILRINNVEETLRLTTEKPAFISLNRGMSFYGKVEYDASESELYLQVKHDTDIVNKYMAFRTLVDKEMLRLMKNPSAKVDEKIVDLYYSLLSDKKLMSSVGAYIVVIFEDVSDPAFAHKYQDLYDVKQRILKSIAQKYHRELMALYHYYDAMTYEGSLVERWESSIKDRSVKNNCLTLLATLDLPEIHTFLLEQFRTADNATDCLVAFQLILKSNIKEKMAILLEQEKKAEKHPVSWENFLSSVASNDSDDYLDIIKRVEKSKSLNIEQANDQRALFGRFANNKKKSLLTAEGRKYLGDKIIQLSRINEYNTGFMLKNFSSLDHIEKEHQIELVKVLIRIITELNSTDQPSIHGMAKRILFGSPKALKNYEELHGKVKL